MALRPYWKGYLKLSLVTCPVQLMPATSESEKVRFQSVRRRSPSSATPWAQRMVGISRLVVSRRERAVMLEPRGKGILL